MSIDWRKILFLLQEPAITKPFIEPDDPIVGWFVVVGAQAKTVSGVGVNVQIGWYSGLLEFQIGICESLRYIGPIIVAAGEKCRWRILGWRDDP